MPRFKFRRNLREKIGKVTLKTAIWTFWWASIIKCVPFELLSKERLRVRVFQASWRRFLNYGVNAIVFGYNLFQAVGFLRNIGKNGLTADSALHVVYFSYAVLSTLFFATMLTKPEEGAMLVNQLDFLMKISKERRLGCKRWYCIPFAMLSLNYYIPLLQFVAAPTLVALFVMNPHGSMYVYSIIPSRLQADLWIKLSCFLLEAAMVYWNFTILNTMYCIWVASVFQNLLWLNELKGHSAKKTCRSRELQVMSYRYVKVLNVLHNDFNQHFSAGFIGALIMFAVLFIYCALVTANLVSIFVYILFPSIGGFCVFLMAAFYPYIALWKLKSTDFFHRIRSEAYLYGWAEEREMILRELQSLQVVKNRQSMFGHTSIAVSQASLEQVFSHIILLMSF